MTGLCGDVRSDVDVANAIASVQELWGNVEVLFNVAGIIDVGPIDSITGILTLLMCKSSLNYEDTDQPPSYVIASADGRVTSLLPGRSLEMQFETAIGRFAREVSRQLNDRSSRLRRRRAKRSRHMVLGRLN